MHTSTERDHRDVGDQTANFSYICVPVTDMRELPKQDSEVVSSGILSESISILEEKDGWVKIETSVDTYQGWVPQNTICKRQEAYLAKPGTIIAHVNSRSAFVYDRQDTVYGPTMTLPFECKLEVLEQKEEANRRWLKVALPDGLQGYIQRGDISLQHKLLTMKEMCELSLRFLELPYRWGGRSSFGYDCSGFVQMLYRQREIFLPRDSKDQAQSDLVYTVSLDSLLPGDLVFFGLAEDKIRHVGMFLGNGEFIHSTVAENKPYIRISRLSDAEWNGSGRLAFRTARRVKSPDVT